MIRYVTAGESHGPELTVIVEGLPAGIHIDEDLIRKDLARRQIALGAGGRMAIETDRAIITGGVLGGVTTGAPVAMRILNKNHAAWEGKEITALTNPRPGHADFAAVVKYGHDDVRASLERASARETASRVAAGACARAMLEAFGITVKGRVVSIGPAATENEIEAEISQARKDGETLGGIIEIVAEGLPIGLGSYVSPAGRLDSRLAAAVIGIQAMKGVEFGDGFALASMKGTDAMDAIENTEGWRNTNHMGGIEGGMTNGMPVVLRAAMKPIPTTLTPQRTVNLATGETAETVYERSDVCPVPRAVVVVEAVVCAVLADALCEKLGGDSIPEMKERFNRLPKTKKLSADKKVFWH